MSTPAAATQSAAPTAPPPAPVAAPSAPPVDDLPIWESVPVTPTAPPVTATATEPPAPPVGDPPAEAPPAPVTPPTPPVTEPPADKALAELARREAAIRQREGAIRSQEQAANKARRLEELARTDPEAALAELGLTYEGVTNHFLDKGAAATPEKIAHQAMERVQAMERAVAERERAAGVTNGINYVRTHVTAGGDKFEHINSPLGENLGAHQAIYQRAVAKYQESKAADPLGVGSLPDLDAIAAEVEAEIESRYAKPALSLKRYAPKAPPVAPVSSGVPGARAQVGSRTLSNATASEGPPGQSAPLPLDPDERDRALNADPQFRIWG